MPIVVRHRRPSMTNGWSISTLIYAAQRPQKQITSRTQYRVDDGHPLAATATLTPPALATYPTEACLAIRQGRNLDHKSTEEHNHVYDLCTGHNTKLM